MRASNRACLGITVNPMGPIRRGVLSLFILFHVIVIICWAVPLNTLLFATVRGRVAPYMELSGLSQSWDLFSPSPLSENRRVEAEIIYEDGTSRIWKFPMPQDFGYVRRYFGERTHKWVDSLRLDANSTLWPDAARYVARLNNDTTDRPRTVKLVRQWSEIAPPGSGQAEPWKQQVFFTYAVASKDLQ
jgi:hypothetical protein